MLGAQYCNVAKFNGSVLNSGHQCEAPGLLVPWSWGCSKEKDVIVFLYCAHSFECSTLRGSLHQASYSRPMADGVNGLLSLFESILCVPELYENVLYKFFH